MNKSIIASCFLLAACGACVEPLQTEYDPYHDWSYAAVDAHDDWIIVPPVVHVGYGSSITVPWRTPHDEISPVFQADPGVTIKPGATASKTGTVGFIGIIPGAYEIEISDPNHTTTYMTVYVHELGTPYSQADYRLITKNEPVDVPIFTSGWGETEIADVTVYARRDYDMGRLPDPSLADVYLVHPDVWFDQPYLTYPHIEVTALTDRSFDLVVEFVDGNVIVITLFVTRASTLDGVDPDAVHPPPPPPPTQK